MVFSGVLLSSHRFSTQTLAGKPNDIRLMVLFAATVDESSLTVRSVVSLSYLSAN